MWTLALLEPCSTKFVLHKDEVSERTFRTNLIFNTTALRTSFFSITIANNVTVSARTHFPEKDPTDTLLSSIRVITKSRHRTRPTSRAIAPRLQTVHCTSLPFCTQEIEWLSHQAIPIFSALTRNRRIVAIAGNRIDPFEQSKSDPHRWISTTIDPSRCL